MTNTKSMDLIETPFKVGKVKDMRNKVSDDLLSKVSTGRIFWHLIKRHKFGLVATWAILITITYMFPPVWDILGTFVR